MAARCNPTGSTNIREDKFPLTNGAAAVNNLHAQIAGQERQLVAGSRAAVADQAELIELVAMRSYLLGVIVDYELAEERADELCRNYPDDGRAYLSLARSRARFHRFAEALPDLDKGERLGTDCEAVGRERATIFQAKGEYDTALVFFFFRRAAETRADFALRWGLSRCFILNLMIVRPQRSFFTRAATRIAASAPFL